MDKHLAKDRHLKPSYYFDEIHNYAGLHGANTPWIIARWKENTFYNEKSNFHVVGLSAT